MNTPALFEVKQNLAPNGDPTRFAIQSDLYNTQFYKGRTDGLPDPERMDAAIKLVQIAAHLPVTGIFNDDVHDAIVRLRQSGDYRTYPEQFAESALKDASQIAWAQRALAQLGYYPKDGPFDGVATAPLMYAFRAFERANPVADVNRYGWLPTAELVQGVRKALATRGLSPDLPMMTAAMPPPQRSLIRDLATFAILTSPAWGLLLYIKRPWRRLAPRSSRSALGRTRPLVAGARAR